jgi:hypothetical protein
MDAEYILGPPPGSDGTAAVMPTGRVHLFCGPSGAGKTTCLFQMIVEMQRGGKWLGYQTQWHPLAYIAFDREEEETHETMTRIGLDPRSVPQFYPKVQLPEQGKPTDDRMEQIISAVRTRYPEAKVLVFDAFFILAAHGQINNYLYMAEWLQRARKLCKELDITIIGIAHSPKEREGHKITSPRQKIQGSVAGGGFTSCTVVVDFAGTADENKRLIYVLPRNAPDEKFEMIQDERGRLVADTKSLQDKLDYLMGFFGGLPRGGSRSTAEICVHMEKVKISRPTVMRYLGVLMADGMVLRVKQGHYAAGPALAGQQGQPAAQPAPWEAADDQ